jgi:class 3 adenylate cyclase
MEYTVLGDAVNIASRLQDNAKPNQILIGDDTYRLVYRLFTTKPLGMISLKGKSHSIQIHEVLSANSQYKPRKLSKLL